MIDYASVVTRLGLLSGIVVGSSVDLASYEDLGRHHKVKVYVLPLRETSNFDQSSLMVRCQVEVDLGIVYAVRDVKESTGTTGLSTLLSTRSSVIAQLLGWTPTGCTDPMSYTGGRVMDFANGIIWWQDTFLTRYYLRSA